MKEGSQAAAYVLWGTCGCSPLSPFPRHFSPNVLTPRFAYYNVQSDHLRLTEFSHQLKTSVTCFPLEGPNQKPSSLRQIEGNRMADQYLSKGNTKSSVGQSKQSLHYLELEIPNYQGRLEELAGQGLSSGLGAMVLNPISTWATNNLLLTMTKGPNME